MAYYDGHWLLRYSTFICPECGREVEVHHTEKCPYCGADFTKKVKGNSLRPSKIEEVG